MAELKHKWENDVCIRCGCEREKHSFGYLYTRSTIIKLKASELPCIDWDVENVKTID